MPSADWLEEAHRVLRAHLAMQLPDPPRAAPDHSAVQTVVLVSEVLFRFWGSRDPARAVGAVAGLEPAFLRGVLRAAAMCHAPWPPSLALRVLRQAEEELRLRRHPRDAERDAYTAGCAVLGEAWARHDPEGLADLHQRLFGATAEGGWWAAQCRQRAAASSAQPAPQLLPDGGPPQWQRTARWGLTARARMSACLALAASTVLSDE